MKQLTEAQLRKIIVEAYERGAYSVEPDEGCHYFPYGSEPSDELVRDAYVEEVMSKL